MRKKSIEHWISSKKPHCLKCQLIPGETYFLVDESAFYGYEIIGKIAFTISKTNRVRAKERKRYETD